MYGVVCGPRLGLQLKRHFGDNEKCQTRPKGRSISRTSWGQPVQSGTVHSRRSRLNLPSVSAPFKPVAVELLSMLYICKMQNLRSAGSKSQLVNADNFGGFAQADSEFPLR